MWDVLRDPIWEFIAVVVSVIGVVLAWLGSKRTGGERDDGPSRPRLTPAVAFFIGASAASLVLLGIGLLMRPSPISINSADIASLESGCLLDVDGRYDLYMFGCKNPADCVPVVLFKTEGEDAYYPVEWLEGHLTSKRGNWRVQIDALASAIVPPTEAPDWCRNVGVFDPRKPFDVFVALAPVGWSSKLADCAPANLGYRSGDDPIRDLDYLQGGISVSCPMLASTQVPSPSVLPAETASMAISEYYRPSGHDGDGGTPEFGEPIRISYDPAASSANYYRIFWQHPENNWTCDPPGRDLRGAVRVTVQAWGEEGGEVVEFGLGLECDSVQVEPTEYNLTSSPQEYVVAVLSESDDLSDIVSPFYFLVGSERNHSPVTFYISDMRIEGISEPGVGSSEEAPP